MKICKHNIYLYIATISFVLSSSAYVKIASNLLSLCIDAIQALVLIYCIFHMLKKHNIDRFLILVILFYVMLGVSTFIGSKEYTAYIVYAIQGVGAVAFISYALQKYPKDTIRILRNILFLFVSMNLILMLVKPGGFLGTEEQTYYLLGLRISFTPFVLCELFFALLNDCFENKKMSVITGVSLIIGVITVWIKNVSTGIVTILVVMILLKIMGAKKKNIELYQIYILYSIIYILIVGFNIQYHIPFLSYFLQDILGKDLTFDNRTTIWLATISEIIKQPFWGHGISGGGAVIVKFQYRIAELSAHTQFLETLYQGGIIAFTFFICMCSQIGKVTRNALKDKYKNISICFVTGFLIMMFTEVQMTKALVFLVFATAANLNKIQGNIYNKGV